MVINGETIRQMRKENGISQKRLAEMAGVTQAHIAKIETSKVNPRLSTVNNIMSVLKRTNIVKCETVMTKKIISLKPNDSVKFAVGLMKNSGISQLPVIDKSMCLGSISEKGLIKHFGSNMNKKVVKDIMEKPFPIISSEDNVEMATSLLEYHPAVLISKKGKIVGIVTKSDLLSLIK